MGNSSCTTDALALDAPHCCGEVHAEKAFDGFQDAPERVSEVPGSRPLGPGAGLKREYTSNGSESALLKSAPVDTTQLPVLHELPTSLTDVSAGEMVVVKNDRPAKTTKSLRNNQKAKGQDGKAEEGQKQFQTFEASTVYTSGEPQTSGDMYASFDTIDVPQNVRPCALDEDEALQKPQNEWIAALTSDNLIKLAEALETSGLGSSMQQSRYERCQAVNVVKKI